MDWGEEEEEDVVKVEEDTELDPLKLTSGSAGGPSLLQELSSLDEPAPSELLQPTVTPSANLINPSSSSPFSSLLSSSNSPSSFSATTVSPMATAMAPGTMPQQPLTAMPHTMPQMVSKYALGGICFN